MSRYFLINLSGTGSGGAVSVYLTSDGLITGRKCKTRIPEAAELLSPESGNTTVGASGSPFTEKPLNPGKGRQFSIKIDWIPTSVYNTLKDLIDHSATNDLAINVTADGEPGSIDVDASPFFGGGTASAPYSVDEDFRPGFIKGLALRFITTAVN